MSDDNAAELLTSKFRRLVELRTQRDEDKAVATRSEKEYRSYEAELWEELADSPIQGTIKLDIGGEFGVVTFQPKETYYGRIIDKDAALEYFENRAMVDEFTKPKIEAARVNELVKHHLEDHKPMPPGIDFYAKRFISISHKS